jgi:hypothetical protein
MSMREARLWYAIHIVGMVTAMSAPLVLDADG